MSRVFGKLVETRGKLYDRGLLTVHRLHHPVISVGNLTVGGTGKTPLVIELASRFLDLGYRPVVLSRGYGRRSRGVVVVSRGRGPEVDWLESGDEPQLIARRLPSVPVVVGERRYQAGLSAEHEELGDLFLLDDGFQHRSLHRDVDIVSVDPVEWNQEDKVLPAGPWRELRTAIERGHAACVQSVPGSPEINLPIPSFETATLVEGLIRDGHTLKIDEWTGGPVAAFAGIAKPDRFFNLLEASGIEVTIRRSFRDHHRFSKTDLEDFENLPTITTEKDAVRLPDMGFFALRISARIHHFEKLQDLILERIAESHGRAP